MEEEATFISCPSNIFKLNNSYGFCMDEVNQYDELRLRVVLSTDPKGKINLASELLPD